MAASLTAGRIMPVQATELPIPSDQKSSKMAVSMKKPSYIGVIRPTNALGRSDYGTYRSFPVVLGVAY